MEMGTRIPKTKEECFAVLDAMLSDKDKQTMLGDDDIDYHFTLGLWIRNNWIYPLKEGEKETFMKMFIDDDRFQNRFFLIHPDSYSSMIIEKYIEYLRDK